MFSVIFPGQGSQFVGMGKDIFDKYDLVKKIFKSADDVLGFSLSKLILEGPKEELNLTKNTQPAIFLVSYSIFNLAIQEFKIELNKAKFFAGHSLGEYSALSAAGYLNFSETIKLLRLRGEAMQNAVPSNMGGMIVTLGSKIDDIEKILDKNQIKFLKLPVSAPFHCSLMKKATIKMKDEIEKKNFINFDSKLISNVTAKEISDKEELKKLLVKQIESRVRWRESVIYMINNGVKHFIEIGPGKVLTGLIKRINKDVKINTINNDIDIKDLEL